MIVCGFFVACDLKGDFIALWEPVFWRWRPYRRPCFGWLCEYPFLRVLRLAVSPLRRLTFLQAPKKVSKKRLPQRSAHSLGLGVPSFRDPSGRIASGLLRCTSSRCIWLRQTVAALPPPDQSRNEACRRGRWIKIRAAAELALILLSGGRACDRLLFCVGAAPHWNAARPALFRGERGPIFGLFKPEFGSWRGGPLVGFQI